MEGEKKLRYCKSQIKALTSDGYHFNIHQMSFIPQWRNGTREKVNIDEQKRWDRDAAEDGAGCWPHIRAVFSTLEGSFKRKPEDLLPQQTDKWQPAFLLPSHFELRDGSVKRWVFIQNTDSQTLNWAWGSVLFFKKKKFSFFIYLTLVGVCCCVDFSLVAESRGYALTAVHGLLVVVASLVAEHRL